MRLETHLLFPGTCQEALDLYAKVLGGQYVFKQTYGASPSGMNPGPGWEDKLIHATVAFPSASISGNDSPPDHYKKPQGASMTVQAETPEEAERIYNELSEGGAITLPLSETPWAAKFGMFTDRFGIPWMINCGKAA